MSKSGKEPTSLGAWPRAVANALQQAGCDPEAAFREADMNWAQLEDPYARYPVSGMMRLWRIAVRVTGDPAIALKAVTLMGPANLHEYSVAILASETLGKAMETLVRYTHFSSEAVNLCLTRDKDAVLIQVDAGNHDIRLEHEAVDAAVSVIEKARRMLYFGAAEAAVESNPIKVELTRPTPQDPTPWDNYFQAPVHFSAARNCLHYSEQSFDIPLPGANSRLILLNEQFLDSYMTALKQHAPIVSRVNHLMLQRLTSGRPSQSAIAQELGISTSTLNRKLREQGLSFNSMLDDIRRYLADQYLQNSNLTLSEITYMLGYSDQSNFSRSFKLWHGCTPKAYRAKHQTKQ